MMKQKARVLYTKRLNKDEPLAGLDNVFEAFGAYRFKPGYTGNLVRVREDATSVEQDFAVDPLTGYLNPTELNAFQTFYGAASLRVPVIYGQYGLGNITQSGASSQGYLRLDRRYPYIDLQPGSPEYATNTGTLTSFLNNRSAVSILSVRSNGADFAGNWLFFSAGASASTKRLNISNMQPPTGSVISGKRTDTDTDINVALVNKGRASRAWFTEVARVDYANAMAHHAVGLGPQWVSETFQTAGSTDATNSAVGGFRLGTAGGNRFGSDFLGFALTTDLLTDAEVQLFNDRASRLIPDGFGGVRRRDIGAHL